MLSALLVTDPGRRQVARWLVQAAPVLSSAAELRLLAVFEVLSYGELEQVEAQLARLARLARAELTSRPDGSGLRA